MSKQIRKVSGLVLATALFAGATASTARAADQLVTNVPFSFVAGDARLPAGKYTLRVVSQDLSIWQVTSVDRRHSTFISTNAGGSSPTPTTPELVFDKFGNQYFLARVVLDSYESREIPLTPAKMEHEIVRLALTRVNAD